MHKFAKVGGLLYGIVRPDDGVEKRQLAVLFTLQRAAPNLAHDTIVAGHHGARKTTSRAA